MATDINEMIAKIKIDDLDANMTIKLFTELFVRAGLKAGKGMENLRAAIAAVAKETQFTIAQAERLVNVLADPKAELGMSKRQVHGTIQEYGPALVDKQILKDSEDLKQKLKDTWDKGSVKDLSIKPTIDKEAFSDIKGFETQLKLLKLSIDELDKKDPVSAIKTSLSEAKRLSNELDVAVKAGNGTFEQRITLADKLNATVASMQVAIFKAKDKSIVDPQEADKARAQLVTTSHQIRATRDLAQEQSNTAKETKKTNDATGQLDKSIGVAIGKLIRYRVAFFAMRGAIRGVKEAITDYIETQFKLAGLEIVINRQTDSIEEYGEAAIKMAQDFGLAIKDIVDVMRIWAQTGLAQNDVLEATKATLIGVNALGATTTEVVEALTAVIFTYGVEVENIITVLSSWLAVQKQFPVDAKDLANALKVVGAAAKVVGVDLNDLAGYVTAIKTTTRKSGSAIGQSLKTMFARLPRKEVITTFEQVGVAVLKSNNELRDLDSVLSDLSKVWGGLSTVQRANVSTTLGGIRRYADFIALMDNYEIKLSAVATAQRGSTEALDANTLILETYKKVLASANAVLEEFSLGTGKYLLVALTTLVKFGTGILKVFNNFSPAVHVAVATFASFASILIAVAVAGIGIKFLLSKLTPQLLTNAAAVKFTEKKYWDLVRAEVAATASTTALGTALAYAGAMMKTVSPVIGWLALAAAALGTFFFLFSNASESASDSVENLTKTMKQSVEDTKNQIEGTKNQLAFLEGAKQKISDLAKGIKEAGKNSSEGMAQFKLLTNLLEVLPISTEEASLAVKEFTHSLDAEGDAIKIINGVIDTQITKNNELATSLKNLLETQKKMRTREIETEKSELDSEIKKISNYKKAVKEMEGLKLIIPRMYISKEDLAKGAEEINLDFVSFLGKVDLGKEISNLISIGNFKEVETVLRTAGNLLENSFEDNIGSFNEELKTYGLLENFGKDEDLGEKAGDLIRGAFKEAKDALEVAKKNMGDNPIDEKAFFSERLEESLRWRWNKIQKFADSTGAAETAYAVITARVQELEHELLKLNGIEPTDSENFIGIGTDQQVIQFEKQLKKIRQEYLSFKDTIKTAQSELRFGEFIDEDMFKLEFDGKSFRDLNKLVDAIGLSFRQAGEDFEELEKIDKAISGLNEKAKKVKIVTILSDELSRFSKEFSNAITTGGKNPTEAFKDLYDQGKKTLTQLKQMVESLKGLELRDALLASHQKLQEILKDIFVTTLDIEKGFAKSSTVIDGQISILNGVKNKHKEIFDLELEKIKLQERASIEIANLYSGTERVKKLEEARRKTTDDTLKLMKDQHKVRIDKILGIAAANAQVLEESLRSAFGNIPTNILSGEERRKELNTEIKEIETEIQDARASGDSDATANAEWRLRNAQKELDTYKRGWYEIGKLAEDILSGIADSFRKSLIKKVTDSLVNIQIGGKSIADIVGDSISVASGELSSTFKETMLEVNTKHEKALFKVLDDNDTKLKDIYGIYEDNLEVLFNAHVDGIREALGNEGFRNEPTKSNIDPFTGIEDVGYNYNPIGSSKRNSDTTIEDFSSGQYSTDFSASVGTFSDTVSKYVSNKESPSVVTPESSEEIDRITLDAIEKGNTDRKNGQKNDSEIGNALQASVALLGVTLASAVFNTKGGQVGSGIGGVIGGAAGSEWGGALGDFGGPLGSILGSFIGGAIGSLFGGDEEEEPPALGPAIQDLAKATIENTLALRELDKSIFNAPTRFNVPVTPQGFGGAAITVNINAQSGSVEDIARDIRVALENELSVSNQSFGSRGYVRV